MEESNEVVEVPNTVETGEAVSESAEVKPEPPKSPGRKSVSFKNGKKYANKKFILPPPPRASPTSSSGFPGVSWNKRMGAWLAFYYDQGTRRSRTFHPKYFEMNVEKAKLAAIDFMKSIERHPKCSLRKNRRERHDWSNSHYIRTSPEFDDETEPTTRRRRKPINKEYNPDGVKRSPLSCSTQASIGELYFDALRPKFLNGVKRDKQIEPNQVRVQRVKRDNEMMDMTPNMFNHGLMWGNCNMFVNSQEYCPSQEYYPSSQESSSFSMPSFNGFTRNYVDDQMYMGAVEQDHELTKLMHSIHNVDPLDNSMNFISGYTCSPTSMSSPYLSPYTHFRTKEEAAMSPNAGFQNMMMQPDGQQNNMMYSPGSSYILPIDSN
ncbi:conserved hypothetical protein [Theileria orientalis strain Shintoku]|uniref:AP2/ERF domain-containing protein n=1 Tax=Theileria orientalis strain Shintoku TaxID=869250 RepID=J4CE17_THEOR|nr:conserved hypothetical protein [Theileria orientalis strain Shintoku]PVC50867.1 hypothetical protein MACL_00001984 [Theileria orientalis]BAM42112.1 conserved hypothetical protein [Theileria orientalis strain Shintoku]|eukprot:XP_009692413.1 conserved hypothetical protein [Theileria orientalis strain Shintoku]